MTGGNFHKVVDRGGDLALKPRPKPVTKRKQSGWEGGLDGEDHG